MESNNNNGDCFEVNVKLKGEVHPMSFNREAISYFRPFVDNESELRTQVYLNGNTNGITIQCGYGEFGAKLDRNFAIKRLLSGLSQKDFDKVHDFAKGLLADQ